MHAVVVWQPACVACDVHVCLGALASLRPVCGKALLRWGNSVALLLGVQAVLFLHFLFSICQFFLLPVLLCVLVYVVLCC